MNPIRKYRKENKMTQDELAEKLGVLQTSISQWELGLCKPRILTLFKMADLFKCKVDDLLREEA